MPVTLRRFTVDELAAFPDDGNRYELLDGWSPMLVGRLPRPGARLEEVSERWLAVEVSGTDSRVHDRENKREPTSKSVSTRSGWSTWSSSM